MAAVHLAHPELAVEKFSGTDPDQDVEPFVQLTQRKIIFALGDANAAANAEQLATNNFRKEALFSSLLIGSAAEWCKSNVEAVTPREDIRTNIITRFSDERNNLCH